MTSMVPGLLIAGRYQLDDLLADAGGARFWRATDTVLARSVALHAVEDSDARADALLRAARESVSFPDPHLLRVLDCDSDEGLVWVVNEWGAGVSLDRLDAPLPADRAVWLVREVAETITQAHAVGLTHGRLVPENVMVLRSGAVKLIGFAIDAAFNGPGTRSGLYPTDDAVAADVHDLGALLYYALTGRWAGASASDAPMAPRDARGPLRPRQVRAGVPRGLDGLCDRILGLAPARPIYTAAGIAAALAEYAGGESPDILRVNGAAVAPAMLGSHATPWSEGDPAEETQLVVPVDDRPTQAHPGPWPNPADTEPTTPVSRSDALSPGESTQLHAPVWGDENDPDATGAYDPAVDQVVDERPLFAPGPPRASYRAPRDDSGDPPPLPQLGPDDQHSWITGEQDQVRDDWDERVRRPWLRTPLVVGVVIVAVAALVLLSTLLTQPDAPPPTQPGSGASGTPAASAQPIRIVGAHDFDPYGDGSEDPTLTPLAIDGNASTAWHTSIYYGSPELGHLKPGVGLILDLGASRQVGSVQVTLGAAPTTLSLYAADTDTAPTTLDGFTKLADQTAEGQATTFTLGQPAHARYLLLWLTSLPPTTGGYRGQIAEVKVFS